MADFNPMAGAFDDREKIGRDYEVVNAVFEQVRVSLAELGYEDAEIIAVVTATINGERREMAGEWGVQERIRERHPDDDGRLVALRVAGSLHTMLDHTMHAIAETWPDGLTDADIKKAVEK